MRLSDALLEGRKQNKALMYRGHEQVAYYHGIDNQFCMHHIDGSRPETEGWTGFLSIAMLSNDDWSLHPEVPHHGTLDKEYKKKREALAA